MRSLSAVPTRMGVHWNSGCPHVGSGVHKSREARKGPRRQIRKVRSLFCDEFKGSMFRCGVFWCAGFTGAAAVGLGAGR